MSAGRERVAVGEIAIEVARAFVASGASSGEARVAGEAAARAEVHVGGGVALAAEGLAAVPTGRIGLAIEAGDPPRLADPADRALLLRVPVGLAWLGGRSDRGLIALPGAGCPAALAGVLLRARPPGVAVAACPIVAGRAEDGLGVGADGALLDVAAGAVPTAAAAQAPDGLVLVRLDAGSEDAVERVSAAALAMSWRAASATGLEVDGAAWGVVAAAAARYLVPDP
ncbi:MAG: hypothetical protein FJW81_02665 [Actinobacteria bacterium]|nr:hypothetical protein [Actinomycetota bacterium]